MRNLSIARLHTLTLFFASCSLATALPIWQASAVRGQAPAAPSISGDAKVSQPAAPAAGPRASGPNQAGATELERDQGAFDLERALSEGTVPMTAEQAAKLAVQNGPSVESARAAQRKAEAGATGAFLAVYPKLDLTARYTRLSKVAPAEIFSGGTISPPPMPTTDFDIWLATELLPRFSDVSFPQYFNQYVLRAAVSYPVSDLFFAVLPGYKAAKRFSEAAAWGVKTEQQKLVQQAREAYYSYARARAYLVVARAALAQVEAHRKDIVAMVNAGTLAKVELMRIDAQVAAARVAIARAEGGVAMARTGLEVLIGRKLNGDVAIPEQLEHPLPLLTETKEQLVAQARQQRPEILSLQTLAEAYDLNSSANAGGRLPHLVLSGGVDYANPNQRIFPSEDKFKATWDVSAVLTWSPNSLFDANSKVSGAEADLAKARADLASLEQGLTIEVTQAYEQYTSALAAMQAAESGIAAAEESYRVRREQFRAGAAVATEVLDAEAGLRNARLELVNAAIDLRIARVKLDHAIGKPL
jgi:outer membrane protein